MHWVIMSTLSVSLVEQMGSQPKWSVIFVFTCLIFSQLPASRVNLLIKLLNDCMDRPTNAMQSDKLPSVTEDLNVLWRLTGSSSMPALSKNQWITKMIRWRVTRTCGITSLHRKIDLWTDLIPSGITEATLLTRVAEVQFRTDGSDRTAQTELSVQVQFWFWFRRQQAVQVRSSGFEKFLRTGSGPVRTELNLYFLFKNLAENQL